MAVFLDQFRLRRNDKRGDGTAVSLPRSILGTRHCRLLRLYHSDTTRIDLTYQKMSAKFLH